MEAIAQWLSQNAVALLALILTPLLAWFFNRRTQNANAKKTDAEGTEILVTSSGKLVTSWEQYAIEIKKEYDESKDRNSKLIESNDKLIEQNKILIDQNDEVKEQNKILSAQLADMIVRLKEYTSKVQQIFTLLLVEIDSTNPDLARIARENFAEVSKIIMSDKNG